MIFEGLSTGKVYNLFKSYLGDVGSSAYISIHNMCAYMIETFGSDEVKEKWLQKMTSFEIFSSYCLTEPDSGSDAKAMKTTAKD